MTNQSICSALVSILLLCAAHTLAQAPAEPSATATAVAVHVPLLGFVMGAGPADVYPILGTVAKPQLGTALRFPASVEHVFLPPRQQFALLENAAGNPLALVYLRTGVEEVGARDLNTISTSEPRPARVVFSPRGDAAALISREGAVQILTGLPAHPVAHSQIAALETFRLSDLAVSDDGALLVAADSDQVLSYSFESRPWQLVATGFHPQVFSFVPHSRNLVIGDQATKSIVILSDLSRVPVQHVLATGVSADRFAFTKEGDLLLTFSSATGSAESIDLASEAIAPVPASQSTPLSALRDGRSFLISASPHLLIWKAGTPVQNSAKPFGEASAVTVQPQTIRLSH